ncbi:putative exported protein [Shewanella sp. HN-41]|nr:putative exported protein [Shewanella sp. HN-41]
MEQPRQTAPRQREEVRVRQSEPRQNIQTARSVEHNQGRSAQSQERRHRE